MKFQREACPSKIRMTDFPPFPIPFGRFVTKCLHQFGKSSFVIEPFFETATLMP